MERPALLFLSATTVAIALVGFAAGRQSVGKTDTVGGRGPGGESPAGELRPRSTRDDEIADLSKVTIENLGQVEFEQAYDLLQAAPREVLSGWTRRLEALPVGPRKTAAITAFFKTLAQLDAKTAVDLALSLTRREPRATATSAIKAATPASSLAEVARLLSSVKPENARDSAIDLIVNWSCTDPVSTSQFVASHPEMADEVGLALLLGNWAALDPGAAKAWLDQLDASQQDPRVYRGFYGGWFEYDRPAALNHLIANAGDEKLNKAIEGVAYVLFSESPATARAFVLDLPEGPARKAAISHITVEAAGHFLRGTPSFSADAVAKWLVTLPADNWQENLGSVVSKWSGEDPVAVEHWLNDMPTPTRDQIAAEFCLAYDSDDPQRNFAAGLTIDDRQLRENTFREVFKKVGSKKRARELLQRANLPREQTAALERLMAQS
jgi:hypothetical protein